MDLKFKIGNTEAIAAATKEAGSILIDTEKENIQLDKDAETRIILSVGEKTPEGGEIFNDYEDNIAGGKGFEITEKVQTSNGEGYYTLKGYAQYIIDYPEEASYAIGDTWSAHIKNAYDFQGTIIDIDGDKIYVSNYVEGAADKDPWTFWVHTKPAFGNITIGDLTHAEGKNTTAIGQAAHAEGRDTVANENYSHAEGRQTKAAYAGHSEGRITDARGMYGHAENFRTVAGNSAHAEGSYRVALGQSSHAEGLGKKNTAVKDQYDGNPADETIGALGKASHVEGIETTAIGEAAHAEGYQTEAKGIYSHAEGYHTIAQNDYSYAGGSFNQITKPDTAIAVTEGIADSRSTNITIGDNYVQWDLTNTKGSNHYCFKYKNFKVGETYKLRFICEFNSETLASANTKIGSWGWEDIDAINSSGAKEQISASQTSDVPLVLGTNIIELQVTTKTYQYIGIRFYNSSAIAGNLKLISAYIVNEEVDTDIIHSIGNGTSDTNRSNAFAVYKDGHVEIGKMGETNNSVVTKEYVDQLLNRIIALETQISNLTS